MRYYQIFILFMLGIIASACISLAEDVTPPPGFQTDTVQQVSPTAVAPNYPLIAPDINKGAAIYEEKCTPCHGDLGLGDGSDSSELPNPVPPIGSIDLARQASPEDWHRIVSDGNLERFMPPFRSLSESQRWDVIAYIFYLSTPKAAFTQGGSLYEQNCIRCHGETGNGKGPQSVDLNIQPKDFGDLRYMADKSEKDIFDSITSDSNQQHDFDGLQSDEKWALTSFIRGFSFLSSAVEDGSVVESAVSEKTDDQGSELPDDLDEEESQPVSEQVESGTIKVQVVDGSENGIPDNFPISIRGYDDMTEVYTNTSSVGEDGFALFEDIPFPLDRVFLATAEFSNVTYSSDIAIAESGVNEINLQVVVYETTNDSSVLVVDRLHIFFEYVEPDKVQVVEFFIISNPSNRMIVSSGTGEPVINFSLPEGAENLQFQDGTMGGRYIATEDGFGDMQSIAPGSGNYDVLFAFDMPYNWKKLDFEQMLSLPVQAIVVMVPEDRVTIKSDFLYASGTRDVQEKMYSLYEGGNLSAGDMVSMQVSGRPGGSNILSSIGESSSSELLIGVGALGIAFIVTGIYMYRKNSRDDLDEDMQIIEGEADDEIDLSSEELMDAIIALDDLFKAGELPEDAYRERRRQLKSQLKEQIIAETT